MKVDHMVLADKMFHFQKLSRLVSLQMCGPEQHFPPFHMHWIPLIRTSDNLVLSISFVLVTMQSVHADIQNE